MAPPTIPAVKFKQLRLRLLSVCAHESIDRMIANLKSYANAEHASIERQVAALTDDTSDPDELAWQKHQLQEEHYFLEESLSLANELAIVALYKKVEISTKRAVTTAFPDVSARFLFKVQDLKNALKRRGIDIEALPSYRAFDELRCINNDVKHSGQVGVELANYPGWTLAKDLGDLGVVYNRLAPGASTYVSELVGELVKQVR